MLLPQQTNACFRGNEINNFSRAVYPSLVLIAFYVVCVINVREKRKMFLKKIMHFLYETLIYLPRPKKVIITTCFVCLTYAQNITRQFFKEIFYFLNFNLYGHVIAQILKTSAPGSWNSKCC